MEYVATILWVMVALSSISAIADDRVGARLCAVVELAFLVPAALIATGIGF